MKIPAILLAMVVFGAVWAVSQEQPKPSVGPVKGEASDQAPAAPLTVTSPAVTRSVVVQERKYYTGGFLSDLSRRETLKRTPYANPASPVQNPAIDLVTGRPRGVILFSLSY